MRTNVLWKVKSFDELTVPELYKIIKARVDIFVVEQNAPYSDLDDYDQKALHFWAETKDGDLLAYCRLFDCGIKYEEASIGRVISTPLARGKGYGKQLISYAVQIIESNFRTKKIRISAQDYLLPFYKNHGFIETNKRYLEDGIPHTEMHTKQ